jgi:hypothetical protein
MTTTFTNRSTIFQTHPLIDTLEDRLQTNVTLSSRILAGYKRQFVVEAKGFRTSYAGTPFLAISRFMFNNKL